MPKMWSLEADGKRKEALCLGCADDLISCLAHGTNLDGKGERSKFIDRHFLRNSLGNCR